MSDPLIALWTAREVHARAPSREALVARARILRRRIVARDAREHVAGAAITLAFGYVALTAPDWGIRIACLALIAGVFAVSLHLWRNRPREDATAPGRDALAYHRGLLNDQRALLAGVGRWYLGPLVPGTLLFVAAVARVSVATAGLTAALISAGIAIAVIAGVFSAILWLNRGAARAIDAELATLERYRQTP